MLRPEVALEHFRRRHMAFRLLPPLVDELPHQRLYGDAPRSRLLLEPALVLRIQASHSDCGGHRTPKTWERISVERWIFTAAHELGHLLLHPHEYRREATDLPEKAEREAHEFASEFLMPECAFA